MKRVVLCWLGLGCALPPGEDSADLVAGRVPNPLFSAHPLSDQFSRGPEAALPSMQRPVAVINPAIGDRGRFFRLLGDRSVDPLGEGLDYEWRVLRAPPTPEPSTVQNEPFPHQFIVANPFAGPWEIGLTVVDARGRRSEEAIYRRFQRHPARLAIELSWPHHASAADLDIHVVQAWANLWDIPGDCHFANASDFGWSTDPETQEDDCWFMGLDDLGVTTGVGPGELIWFRDPQEGAMDVVIHEFASGAPEADEEPVMVRIWLDNRLIYDTLEQRPSTEWWVARVDLKTNTAIRLDPPVESPE